MGNRPVAADKKRLRGLALAVGLGAAYFAELQLFGLAIPCPLHLATGLRCPACGITRSVLALARGQWAQAARCNVGLWASLPVLVPVLGVFLYRYLTGRRVSTPGFERTGIALIVYFVAWGVARNLWGL